MLVIVISLGCPSLEIWEAKMFCCSSNKSNEFCSLPTATVQESYLESFPVPEPSLGNPIWSLCSLTGSESQEFRWLNSQKQLATHLTLSPPAVHAKYTSGNQQYRSTLQLRTSCAGVLHCRSLPTYFKLLHLLNHSSNLIHLYLNIKTTERSTKWIC